MNRRDPDNIINTLINLVLIWWFAEYFPTLVEKIGICWCDLFEIVFKGSSLEIIFEHSKEWLVITFGASASFVIIRLSNPARGTLPDFFNDAAIEEIGNADIIEKAKVAFSKEKRKRAFLRCLLSLGLIFIRERILEHIMGIRMCGTFKASKYSPVKQSVFNYLDIISYQKKLSKPSVRYLYSRNFEYILVSKAERHESFGKDEKRFPNWGDIGLLLLASNFFLFWFPIALISWPYHAIKKACK